MLSRSARLGIGGVVGNGQGIGVKHPYGLALAAHLNLVFASDDHNKPSVIPVPTIFLSGGGLLYLFFLTLSLNMLLKLFHLSEFLRFAFLDRPINSACTSAFACRVETS